jgi:hypothetical protein
VDKVLAASTLVLLFWPSTALAQSGGGISDLYYPAKERTWAKTAQKWVAQIALDGVFNIAKEFWPDTNHLIFHGRY